ESADATKGPRRRHRNGGKNGASPTHRQEPRRSPHGGGKAEGIQGVAFLHRESRPNHRPNRKQQPN
ncbi:MAG TPA: RNA helicase, partial [Bradyrhizobium sp.]|nr:RNA helicase [Bradyrhizobium sp.]